MKNLEIKLQIFNRPLVEVMIQQMGARPGGVLHQVDTYFYAPSGRLKVRDFADGTGELIYYDRNESGQGQRWSRWQAHPLEDPQRMCRLLGAAIGIRGRVDKKRTVYFFEDARIHLDNVRGLGNFFEVESVAVRGDRQARITFNHIINSLELNPSDQILCSYIDLLEIESHGQGILDTVPKIL